MSNGVNDGTVYVRAAAHGQLESGTSVAWIVCDDDDCIVRYDERTWMVALEAVVPS